MKLITLQNKRVLDIINTKGEYIPASKYNMMEDEYKEMFYQYNRKIGIPIEAAVWAWYVVNYERTDKLPDNTLLSYMENFYSDDGKDTAILLEVPDELVFLSDAYGWASYIADPPELQKENPYLWDAKVDWDNSVDMVQAIFPSIKKEYVIDWVDIDKGNTIIWK